MKKLLLIGTILISTSIFAASQLTKLGSVWKQHQLIHPNEGKHDVTMVYGGEDISRRPTIKIHDTIA